MSNTESGGPPESRVPPPNLPPIWPPPPGGFQGDGYQMPVPPSYPVATNAVLILVLGIVSIFTALLCGLGGLIGIAPWMMGNISLRAINQGLANPMERAMVNGGRICGIVGVGLLAATVVFYLGFLAFEYFTGAMHTK